MGADPGLTATKPAARSKLSGTGMQRTAMAAVGLVLALVAAASPSAQQGGDRDVFVVLDQLQEPEAGRAEPRARNTQGRGVIRGLVTSAATGAPVRGATVRAVFGSGDGGPQSAVTDDNGGFELRGLLTGSWSLSASKSGFVPRNYGQRGPSGSGTILTVTDKVAVTANIALIRGAAVMGHVFDEFGDPAVGARVQAMQIIATENGKRIAPVGTPDITDDTGAYRVYGLLPGEYLISARSPSPFDGDAFIVGAGERLIVSTDRLQARPIPTGLRQRAATYFPGTSDISVADRVGIGAGDERSGIDFALVKSPILRISGTVINSSGERPTGAVSVTLNSDSPDLSANAVFGMNNPSANGGFDFRDVSPGSYTLGVSIPGVRMEMAEVPLRVTEDLVGLEVVTAPGVALRGSVVASDASTLPELRGMVVRAQSANGQRPIAFAATSGAVIDGSFQVPNLLGTFRLAVERVPVGWMLKAIEVDGVDVTDTPVTFKPGQKPQATVVLTNRIADLSGVVTNDDRQPVAAAILIFPDDPAKWTAQRFARPLRASDDGRFSLRGLPAHDKYLAVATDYLDPNELRDPEFLERLRTRATEFSLEEGQSQKISLTFIERSAIDGR
jgi:hypothetical protein